jgi:hypothetical protein
MKIKRQSIVVKSENEDENNGKSSVRPDRARSRVKTGVAAVSPSLASLPSGARAASHAMCLRVDREIVDRIDAARDRCATDMLIRRRVTRSDVLREIVRLGLEAFERRLRGK